MTEKNLMGGDNKKNEPLLIRFFDNYPKLYSPPFFSLNFFSVAFAFSKSRITPLMQ